MTQISKIAIVGAGLMGIGIAQVAAQVGKYEVTLCSARGLQESICSGIETISNNLRKSVARNLISENEMSKTLEKIYGTLDLKEAVSNAEFIIETVIEDRKQKKFVLKRIDEFAEDRSIVVTNTSSISISELATSMSHPENFCGMHFFNPPQSMELVEITRGKYTSEATVQEVITLSHKLEKETVVLKKDCPGFIVNRILLPAMNEAAELFYSGVADKEDIDKAIRLGLKWPMGPLSLMDLIGIDTIVAIAEVLGQELDPKFLPNNRLKEMKERGHLGRKTGRGFYVWSSSGPA